MPVIMPVIVPVEHKVNCIVQNNKTYCEKEPATAYDAIFIGGGGILFILWMLAVIYAIDNDYGGFALFLFFTPFIVLLVGGLLCL